METPRGPVKGRQYESRLAEVCARLNHHRAHYVLVGARAVQLWGSTRATRDIDILIEPTVANARRVLAALTEIGFGLAAEWAAPSMLFSMAMPANAAPNNMRPRASRSSGWRIALGKLVTTSLKA